jgi:N-carbamoylputrescine amidase
VTNRAGNEIIEGEKKERDHFGKSAIIDPMGEVVAIVEKEPWTYVAAEIDLGFIDQVNEPLPWRRDRRPELYGIITSSKREGLEEKGKRYDTM